MVFYSHLDTAHCAHSSNQSESVTLSLLYPKFFVRGRRCVARASLKKVKILRHNVLIVYFMESIYDFF